MKISYSRAGQSLLLGAALASALSGCANAPLIEAGTLSSYDGLAPGKSKLVKSRLKVDESAVILAKTVRIIPTTTAISLDSAGIKDADRILVTNAIDRALCIDLSDRFEVVASNAPADLSVHTTVTRIMPTDKTAAGISTAASLGTAFILPVSTPRIPIGLGGLSVEAEALGADGSQKAAIVWAKGANSLTTKARMSAVGDAYSLAAAFGADFGKMLTTGKTPYGKMPSLPSGQKIRADLGGKYKYAACEAFGRAPGVKDMVGGRLGLSPSLTDSKPSQ